MSDEPVTVRTIPEIAAELALNLDAFPARILRHMHFRSAASFLRCVLDSCNIFLLIGPARVGKGAMIEDLIRELNEPIEHTRDQLRAVVVTAPSAQGRAFSMVDLWKDALVAMHELLVERKVDLASEASREKGDVRPKSTPSEGRAKSARDRKRQVCNAAIDRGLQLLVIDEAYAIVKTESGVTLMEQLDVLRTLADNMPFRIALVSTGRLLEKFKPSGELLGRMGLVYFPNYGSQFGTDGKRIAKSDPVADRKAHLGQLVALQEELPERSRLRPTPEQLEYLYSYSLGCVGLLVTWYRRAIVHCNNAGRDCLRWSDFKATVLPKRTLDTLRGQCEKGEAKLLEHFAAPPFSGADDPSDGVPAPPSGSSRKRRESGRRGIPAPTRMGKLHDIQQGLA